MCSDFKYDDSFWEEALFNNNKMIVEAKIVLSSEVIEINTYWGDAQCFGKRKRNPLFC